MKIYRYGVAVAALTLLAAGCRGGEPAADGDGAASTPGVTSEACPDAVNPDNGCIYLGTLSDLTQGPFAALGGPITEAQAAFWNRVNENGGIGGYDIDATTHVGDNHYNPQRQQELFREMEGDVLALTQTLGTPPTEAILPEMKQQDMIGAPASWTSLWAFEENILASGASYCVEGMNIVDHMVQNQDVGSVMSVGYPGDYGGDGAAGAEIAAQAHDLDFQEVETAPGTEEQDAAISSIVSNDPDLVVLGVGPSETAVIVGQAAAQGYQGQFVGLVPTWNPALLDSAAAEALQAMYLHSGTWGSFGADTPGHEAMREALGDVQQPNDGYTVGWVWAYPIKAALTEWLEGDYEKSRAGLLEAANALENVDYEGMLPEEAGDRTGDPMFRQTLLNEPDPEAAAGLSVTEDFFTGPTAESHEFDQPCFQ